MVILRTLILLSLAMTVTATEDEDLVKERQNVILIQKIGQIDGGVKMGYLKMTLDSQVVFKRMKKVEDEFTSLPPAESAIDPKAAQTTVNGLRKGLDVARSVFDQLKSSLDKVVIEENPVKEGEIVIEVELHLEGKTLLDDKDIVIETMNENQDNELSQYARFLLKKAEIMTHIIYFDFCIVNGKGFHYEKFDPELKATITSSIGKIRNHYENYVAVKKILYDITVTEIKDGKYEIYVHVPMQIQAEDQTLELFRIHPIPMVYQNRVMMQVETNLRTVGVNFKTSKIMFFESLNKYRTKSWDNHGYYQSSKFLEVIDFEDVEETCETALITKDIDGVRQRCSFRFLEPSAFTVSTVVSDISSDEEIRNLITFTPEDSYLRMFCGIGSPADATLILQGLQSVHIPDPTCILMIGFNVEKSFDFQIGGERIISHELTNHDLENIWPELKRQDFRINVTNVENTFSKDEL